MSSESPFWDYDGWGERGRSWVVRALATGQPEPGVWRAAAVRRLGGRQRASPDLETHFFFLFLSLALSLSLSVSVSLPLSPSSLPLGHSYVMAFAPQYMYIHICIHALYVCMYKHITISACMYMCRCVHIHMYMYMCIYVYMYGWFSKLWSILGPLNTRSKRDHNFDSHHDAYAYVYVYAYVYS